MTDYQLSQPKSDVVRVEFPLDWNAEAESAAMFQDVLAALDNADPGTTLLVVANETRPVYDEGGIGTARDILFHDFLKRIVVVADGASNAVAHMSATRGERGLPPIPILAFDSEASARETVPEVFG